MKRHFLADMICTDGTFDCYTDETARTMIVKAGIGIVASGKCTNQLQKNCTSFQQIHRQVILDVLALPKTTGCQVIITGGTEVGRHDDGNLKTLILKTTF